MAPLRKCGLQAPVSAADAAELVVDRSITDRDAHFLRSYITPQPPSIKKIRQAKHA